MSEIPDDPRCDPRLSGYYTWDNFAKLIKSGFSSTGPTAALFVFSVLYFGIMTDAGMFDELSES